MDIGGARSNDIYVMVPSKYLSGGHTCTDKIVVFIMYTETHFVLCTGLQLQPTVCYVIIDCNNYKADYNQ